MSADRTYRIRVDTVGDPSGAERVTRALDKTNEKVKEGTGLNEKHAAGLHALHKLFHSLNEVVPGLGVVMQAAFSPIGATISIAVMALQLFREHMKAVNDEFKKLEEEAATPATNRLVAFREATVAAAEGMDALYRSLDRAALGEQTLAQVTEKTTAAFKEEIQAATNLAEAVKENDLAALEQSHAAGLVSEEEYASQRLEIELRYQQQKRELQEREAMTEILTRRRLLEQAEIKQPELTAAAEAAELSKTKALEDLGSLDKAGVEQRRKDAAEKLKKWQPGLLTANGQGVAEEFASLGPAASPDQVAAAANKTGNFYGPDFQRQYNAWAKLRVASDSAEREWKQFPRVEAERKVAADRASDAAAEAARKAVENQSFIIATGQDISERRTRYNAQHQADEDLSGIERDTLQRRQAATAANSPTGKLLQDVAVAMHTLQHGGQVSLGQQSEIKTVIELVNRANIAQGATVIEGLGHLHGSVNTITRQIADLVQKLGQQHKQLVNQDAHF